MVCPAACSPAWPPACAAACATPTAGPAGLGAFGDIGAGVASSPRAIDTTAPYTLR